MDPVHSSPTAVPRHARGDVIVGLSGGVDSAVSALLLQQAGYRVTGLFMKNWQDSEDDEYCSALSDLADAQQVADTLNIELLTANFSAEYWDNVFEEFLHEYERGRTPNPDVLCNREIKFKYFADYARQLGADYVATGHYARLGDDGELRKAADAGKDQTYFLQAVPAAAFRRVLFPLGDLLKSQVREIAADAGFDNYAKKDSTGICFIGERRFRDFLGRYLRDAPGAIVDTNGVTLGSHQGLHLFTLGQRQGLGVGGDARYRQAPWFVCAKDPQRRHLIVTQDEQHLRSDWLAAADINWLGPRRFNQPLHARIRHRQQEQRAWVSPRADGLYRVRFEQAQRAVTPGQYVCLYDGDRCLGGGRIEQAGLEGRPHAVPDLSLTGSAPARARG